MFQASLGGGFGAQEYGLRASIKAAVAYDELCSQFVIDITFQPQAIVIEGRIPPQVARRVRDITVEVAGSVAVWDRTFCSGDGEQREGPARRGALRAFRQGVNSQLICPR